MTVWLNYRSNHIQLRVQQLVLNALDTLYEKLEHTKDNRTARVFIEMANLANQITKDRQDREGLPEPNIQVLLSIGSLEEQLGLPEDS